jgi:hypothetical protein
MPTWDQKLTDSEPATKTKYKVCSIAVPLEEHEDFKRLLNRAVDKHRKRRPGEFTHHAVRQALEKYVR